MAEEKKQGEYYLTEPTSRQAQEAMLENMKNPTPVGGMVSSDPEKVNAPYAVEDNDTSDYIGVSSEYMTYANDTEKPLAAEEGVEAELLEMQTSGLAYRKPQEVEQKEQTVGTGSSVESVYTATSGENFSSEVVDPTSVEGSAENPDTATETVAETQEKVLSAPTPPVGTSNANVSTSASSGSDSSSQ